MTGEWPDKRMDHRDLDRSNNRWSNLRLASNTENGANRAKGKNNTSGHKGVSWCKNRQKWQAGIKINYRRKALGRFDTKEEAAAAYAVAAQELFGEFARV